MFEFFLTFRCSWTEYVNQRTKMAKTPSKSKGNGIKSVDEIHPDERVLIARSGSNKA